ncbi:MAG: hypothetical protein J5778_06790 [Clostridiales bacterium]|nr:hypothetical protein [Clostridiales bacterium]
MGIRHILTSILALILIAAFLPFGNVYALETKASVEITSLEISVTSPVCGSQSDSAVEWYPYLCAGDSYPDKADAVELIRSQWVSEDKDGKLTPFEGTFTGGEKYKVYISFKLRSGYSFAKSLNKKKIGWDKAIENGKIIEFEGKTVTFTCDVTAVHDKDPESTVMTSATCVSPELETYFCLGCGQEIEVKGRIDPSAHNWSNWDVLTPATTLTEGKRSHICSYCNKVETVRFPRLYTHVYEPQTSWQMSATVAWPADESVFDLAKENRRPATVFVWLDKDLKVYDRNGKMLSDNIENYVKRTSSSLIPAFYIDDADTAYMLKTWLNASGLKDCFVVSTPRNRALVKDVADIVQVRGMLDYSALAKLSKHDIADISDAVNSSHGRVVIISSDAATKDNIRTLQSIGVTVWVKTPADLKTIVTHYTNGVNGVVAEDYEKAMDAVEFFDDDSPTLLRIPFIIGHRGDPSNYAENTLEAARGAYEEGADMVENDIHLSKDGEIVIKHDSGLDTFTGLDGKEVKQLTLDELKGLSFVWDGELGIREINEVNSANPTYGKLFSGKLYGEDQGYEYKIPTLREYLEEFKDTDLNHVIEIKSSDTKIISKVRALIDEYDMRDKVFVITFGQRMMRSMYKNSSGFSLGALGLSIRKYSEGYPYKITDEVCEEEGAEAALERVYDRLDRWNASMNVTNPNKDVIRAARHRGLTAWPWTYTLPYSARDLAEDYIFGMNGLTVDQPWFASDFITEIRSEDITAKNLKDLPKPKAITKAGDTVLLQNAELLFIDEVNAPGLAIWRYKESMIIDEESYGEYYLYSNPFMLTIIPEDNGRVEEDVIDEPSGPSAAGAVIAVVTTLAAGAGLAFVLVRRKKKDNLD